MIVGVVDSASEDAAVNVAPPALPPVVSVGLSTTGVTVRLASLTS